MKVLIVFNHPAPYKVAIFNELAKYCDLTVIFERNKENNRPDDYYVNNDYHFNSITLTKGYIGNDGSYSSMVKKYIKKHHDEYDHIIMNGYSHLAEIKAIRYLKKHHINYSLFINGGVIKKENKLKAKYKESLIKGATFYMSPDKRSNQYLVRYGAEPNKIHNYPYSNLDDKDLLKGDIDKIAIRKKYNLPLDKKIFINASQFIDRKNNIQLLKEFLAHEEILLLVGEGIQKPLYEQFIRENNMDNVIIMPFLKRDDLFELMRGADAFITLAKEDIYGQTTLEALANGLPVISSNNINSSLEYIVDGYNGYIVDLLDSKKIQESIASIDKIDKNNTVLSVKNITYQACGKRLYEILKSELK